jgi:methionyl-tRNA formyltransferase
MAALRIIFMGTPDLACPSLQSLLNAPDLKVVAVVTQPDRPKGRDLKLQPSPVKTLAIKANLPVLQPERARNEEFVEELRRFQPDLIAVAAYGQILPKSLLDLPRFGCLNLHTSLLPKYRGAAPIQWAILNGDPETGVTIMKIDVGLDTGDILTQETTSIQPDDTSEILHDRLARMGANLLVRTIRDHAAGKTSPRPQPAQGVVYATIWNRVRGLIPWPGAFTFLPGPPQPHLLKIWQAEVVAQTGQPGAVLTADKTGIVIGCGHDALRVLVLQREGGRRLSAQEFLAGHPLRPGQWVG